MKGTGELKLKLKKKGEGTMEFGSDRGGGFDKG